MRPTLRALTYAAVCLALAIAVQSLRLGQAVTGPTVNAVLYTAAGATGPLIGAVVGLFTPLFALLLGQLAPPLAPAVPFIMIANGLMVASFALLLRYNRVVAILVGSAVKYGALWVAVTFFLKLPPPIVVALGLPQLFTALAGGVVAVGVLETLRRAGLIPVAPRHRKAT